MIVSEMISGGESIIDSTLLLDQLDKSVLMRHGQGQVQASDKNKSKGWD